MTVVFVSYRHTDADAAEEAKVILAEGGFEIWVDTTKQMTDCDRRFLRSWMPPHESETLWLEAAIRATQVLRPWLADALSSADVVLFIEPRPDPTNGSLNAGMQGCRWLWRRGRQQASSESSLDDRLKLGVYHVFGGEDLRRQKTERWQEWEVRFAAHVGLPIVRCSVDDLLGPTVEATKASLLQSIAAAQLRRRWRNKQWRVHRLRTMAVNVTVITVRIFYPTVLLVDRELLYGAWKTGESALLKNCLCYEFCIVGQVCRDL